MKVKIILIVICALGTIPKGLVKWQEDLEIKGQEKTIQTTALLRLVKLLRSVLEAEETCCHSNSSERQSINADVKKNSKMNNNNNAH